MFAAAAAVVVIDRDLGDRGVRRGGETLPTRVMLLLLKCENNNK